MQTIHPSLKHSNKTYEWFPLDTKELFEKNLVNRRNELEKQGWVEQSIKYEFNDNGFRKSLKKHNNGDILFLGCSYTFGIGINYQSSFTNIVCEDLKMNNINWSIPGSSNDTSFRLLNEHLSTSNPKMVIFVSPNASRFELFTNEKNTTISHNICVHAPMSDPPLPTNEKIPLYFFNDRYSMENREKNKLAIEMVCQKNKIKLFCFKDSDLEMIDYGRDLMHPGINSNLLFSRKILDSIKI
mgnify:FL=1